MKTTTEIRATLCATAVLSLGLVTPAAGQSIAPDELLHPSADSWLTYHGDYSGKRHSALKQITPENVANLEKLWEYSPGNQAIKASPIVVDDVIYIAMPDHLYAIDARTAKELWHYDHPPNSAFHIGHRGAAIQGGTVYLTTPDCHLIALDAADGKVKWDVEIADSDTGYWSTNAPLIVGDKVMVGVSGDFDNVPGRLTAVNAETGKVEWIFYSTPPAERSRGLQRRRHRRPDVDHRHL